ncbi:hypothetical protein PVAP13_3NG267800 [Panicum virgatum]|uniref:Uncharacterized protein n=1 Tax=Panicum virgatum TaxID=38727 RepID=A0A8T0UCI2_PANVG|nr:hypothetical protein PVAP13_3NG267800 [Panicum virgatum]
MKQVPSKIYLRPNNLGKVGLIAQVGHPTTAWLMDWPNSRSIQLKHFLSRKAYLSTQITNFRSRISTKLTPPPITPRSRGPLCRRPLPRPDPGVARTILAARRLASPTTPPPRDPNQERGARPAMKRVVARLAGQIWPGATPAARLGEEKGSALQMDRGRAGASRAAARRASYGTTTRSRTAASSPTSVTPAGAAVPPPRTRRALAGQARSGDNQVQNGGPGMYNEERPLHWLP